LVGPTSAAPAGTLAVLADPAGALFGLWEPELRQGAQLVNEPSAWAMSALQTTDPAGAKAFYGELFGWNDEPFDAGGVEVTLWRMPGYVGGEPQQPVPRDVVAVLLPLEGEESQSFWGVDLWIDDVDAAAAKALRLGGSVLVAPHDTPGFKNAVLADAHGAAFSLNELKH
jgi:predicted enzyme related to lactoylglutathione lyase